VTEGTAVDSGDAQRRALIRAGGAAALALAASYIVVTALYSVTGLVPTETGEAWLTYLQGKAPAWWGIVYLSALTDVLFLPVAAALYVVLGPFDRNLALAGSAMLVLFAILDLAVTQISFAALITLSEDYAATTDDDRAALVAAASYPVAVFRSSLFATYVLALPGVGILLLSLVMRSAGFSRFTIWTGVLAGGFGVLAVVAPLAWTDAGYVPILAAVLTTLWVLLVGWRLVRWGGESAIA
jgi:Domain of unknown function (DUF4386)